jgi:hypothetical protein
VIFALMSGEMALELSKQAYELCREQDASGLQAFLSAHAADIDLYLHEGDEEENENGDIHIHLQHHGFGCSP